MINILKIISFYLFITFAVLANETDNILEINIDGSQRISYDTILSYGGHLQIKPRNSYPMKWGL